MIDYICNNIVYTVGSISILLILIFIVGYTRLKEKYNKEIQEINNASAKVNDIMKLIYVDEESIDSYLIFKNNGSKKNKHILNKCFSNNTILSLDMSIVDKLKLLFTNKVEVNYDQVNETVIEQKNINMFLEDGNIDNFKKMSKIKLMDIEGSFTSYRFIMPFFNIVKGDITEGIDIGNISSIFDEYEGYNVFAAEYDGKEVFLRFNSKGFKSNYKRMEIIQTPMNLYTLKIGDVSKNSFEFNNEVQKMGNTLNVDRVFGTNDEVHPSEEEATIELYDVFFAYIGDPND